MANATLAFHFAGTGAFDYLFNSVSLAHNLLLQPPMVTNNTPYLPMKPVTDTTNYVLGRSWLQQIYLVADYHNFNFSISQVALEAQEAANYVTIPAPAVTLPPTPAAPSTTPQPTHSSSHGLSGGAIAGLTIGILAAVALILGAVIWWTRRRRNSREEAMVPSLPPPPSDAAEKFGSYQKAHTHELSNDHAHRTIQEMYTPTNLNHSTSFQKPVELDNNQQVPRDGVQQPLL